MIATNSASTSQKLRELRHHGMAISDRIRHESKRIIIEDYNSHGYNYRMTDIQASIGIKQLSKLPRIIKKRRKIASFYNKLLGKSKHLVVPKEPNGYESNYQSYSVRLLSSSPVSRNDSNPPIVLPTISPQASGFFVEYLYILYPSRSASKFWFHFNPIESDVILVISNPIGGFGGTVSFGTPEMISENLERWPRESNAHNL